MLFGPYASAFLTTTGMIPTHTDSFRFTGVIVILPKSLLLGSPWSSSGVGGSFLAAFATVLVLAFFAGGVGLVEPGVAIASVPVFTIVAFLDIFLLIPA